jgi:hypothetical protein
VLGDADTTDRATRSGNRERRFDSLLQPHAFQHGVRAVLGQLADPFDSFLAALADDVGGSELSPERDPIRIAAEQNDPFGAKPLRRDHTAQPDRTVADDRDDLARANLRRDGCVVAGAHHVRERQQGRRERVVEADGQHDQRAIGLRDTHRLALAAVYVVPAIPATMQTRARQTLSTENTRSVRPEKRRHNLVADPEGLDLGADRLDDPNELVAHPPTRIIALHRLIGPEIATTDRGTRDANECVRGIDESGVRDILHPNIASFVHHCRPHARHLSIALNEARLPLDRRHRDEMPER